MVGVDDTTGTNSGSHITQRPAFWFGLIAVAGLLLVLVIWPKYQKRREILDRQYHARNLSYEYRVHQSNEYLKNNPQDTPKGWPWPVVLAFLALFIPLLALVFSVLTRPNYRPTSITQRHQVEPPSDPVA